MSEPGALLIGPYRAGEIPPPLVVTFKDASNLAIDLSSGYVGRFIYQRHLAAGWPDFTAADPTQVTMNAVVLNQTTNKGQVAYTWLAADFATAGYYEGEMWTGNGTNRYSSIRYMWQTVGAISIPNI